MDDVLLNFNSSQCDQMVRLFLNIWPFATLKISPTMSQICQSRLSILPNKNKLSNFCQRLVNFCQSGKISPNLVILIFWQNFIMTIIAFNCWKDNNLILKNPWLAITSVLLLLEIFMGKSLSFGYNKNIIKHSWETFRREILIFLSRFKKRAKRLLRLDFLSTPKIKF